MSRNYKSDSDSNGLTLGVKQIFRGILVSFCLLLIGSIIIGSIITFINFNEHIVQKILIIFNYVSILVGAFFTGYNVQKKGWLNGSLVGLAHMLLIVLVSTFWLNISFNTGITIMLVVGLLTGLIGGMFGINCR